MMNKYRHQIQLSFYELVRKKIKSLNIFVLQQSFPDSDGAGFCVTGPNYNVVVINTKKQISSRRLFTLAHEVYHCALGESGVSDPDVINNAFERKCNKFAVAFLAPTDLVAAVAAKTIY